MKKKCKCGKTLEDWMNDNYPQVRICKYCEVLCGFCKNFAEFIKNKEGTNDQ